MSLLSRMVQYLAEPDVVGCPMDGQERFEAHRCVLARKTLIRDVFVEFHRVFRDLDARFLSGSGHVIELGAGVYPVRETTPGVVATDVVAAPHLDRVLDAEAMELPDSCVRAFYLQNVFHHFPRPSRFFHELERTLLPGGGAIIIEPHAGPLAALLYPRLFNTERYDRMDPEWEAAATGPMTGANQALSHLIFDRDLERFVREHPTLEIVHRDVLDNWLRYLVSGGLNFRSLLPGSAGGTVRRVERMLRPLRNLLGLHRVIVLRRRSG